MTQLSVRQAAERVGVSRQTMFRRIAEGRVSATNNRQGQKQIAVSELLRVFGELQTESVSDTTPVTVRDSKRQTSARLDVTASQALEIERLKGQLVLAEERLQIANERVSELKVAKHELGEEKNRLLTVIERQTLLLAAPVAQQPETPKTVSPSRAAKPRQVKASKPNTVSKKAVKTATKTVKRPAVKQSKTPTKTVTKRPVKVAPKGRK